VSKTHEYLVNFRVYLDPSSICNTGDSESRVPELVGFPMSKLTDLGELLALVTILRGGPCLLLCSEHGAPSTYLPSCTGLLACCVGKGCDNLPPCSFRRCGIFDLEEALAFFFILSG
jgi:hypothetical protein